MFPEGLCRFRFPPAVSKLPSLCISITARYFPVRNYCHYYQNLCSYYIHIRLLLIAKASHTIAGSIKAGGRQSPIPREEAECWLCASSLTVLTPATQLISRAVTDTKVTPHFSVTAGAPTRAPALTWIL